MNEMNANAVETKEPENATAATPPKIIAVDFDGCLAVNKWPEVGEPIWKNINRLKEEQANGTKVILWTNRVGEPLEKAVSFCPRSLFFPLPAPLRREKCSSQRNCWSRAF